MLPEQSDKLYLRGMMSRVAKKTRTWISETAVRNSADLN